MNHSVLLHFNFLSPEGKAEAELAGRGDKILGLRELGLVGFLKCQPVSPVLLCEVVKTL